jgi:hypothetical protein
MIWKEKKKNASLPNVPNLSPVQLHRLLNKNQIKTKSKESRAITIAKNLYWKTDQAYAAVKWKVIKHM